MKQKILFLDRDHPYLPELLFRKGYEVDFASSASFAELQPRLTEYIGVVLRSRLSIDAQFLAAAPNLQFIARIGIGLEHIDVQAAAQRNIAVLNSPEGSKNAVGEQALGFILNLLNHITRADREVKQGLWNREPNRGRELGNCTVGIIGYGNTGQSLARKLSGFDCTVLAYDKYRTNYGDSYAQAVDLASLQAAADIISLHIPYEADNHYFIKDAFFAACKQDIYLINTARGLVLETAALVRALRSGQVAGAALDVLEYEETSFEKFRPINLPEDFIYLQQSDRVILTPHIAGWTVESKLAHAKVLGEKILKLLMPDSPSE